MILAKLKAAIRARRQSEVSSLVNRLGELIEHGATLEQVTRDLVNQVDRRANRACKIGELEIRREEKITARELAAVFGQWLGILEQKLDRRAFYGVLPELRRVTSVRQIPAVGPGGEGQAEGAS